MLRKVLLSLAAIVVAVGLAVGASLLTPARKPPAQTVDLVRATKLTCVGAGRVLVLGDADISATPLGEPLAAGTRGPLDTTIDAPTIVSANSLIVGGVLTSSPVAGYTPCTAPMPSGVFQVADPASTELVLSNPDANEAAVDLTLMGPDGEITAVGSRGIAIAPGVTRTIALSVLAPEGPVGVAYTTSQGRVSVLARSVPGRTVPSISARPAAEQSIVGGIPPSAQGVQLLLSNPSEDRLDVSVVAFGATSTYEPAPAADLTLPPLSVLAVDLGTSLAGEASGLRIDASQPIGATVLVGPAGAQNALSPGEAAESLGVLAVDVETVQVTNPGVAPVTATLTVGDLTMQVSVPAGTTVSVPAATSGVAAVTVTSDTPVLADAVSADGKVVFPLAPTVEDASVAGVVVADPSLR